MLEVITGPMFAGKSEELIRRLQQAETAGLGVMAFKFGGDNRYSSDQIASHSGWRFPCHPIANASELSAILSKQSIAPNIIGIDEAHFFGETFVSVVQSLIEYRIRVIVAGLNLDYRGSAFGPMPQLLSLAIDITRKTARCSVCAEPAHFTHRTVECDEQVLIGAGEFYEPRCRTCFVPGKPDATAANFSKQLLKTT